MDTVHYDRNDRYPQDIAEYLLRCNYTVYILGNRNNRVRNDRSVAHRTQRDTDIVQLDHIEIWWIQANRHKVYSLHLVPDHKSRVCTGRSARPRSDVDMHSDLCLDHICGLLLSMGRKLKIYFIIFISNWVKIIIVIVIIIVIDLR